MESVLGLDPVLEVLAPIKPRHPSVLSLATHQHSPMAAVPPCSRGVTELAGVHV